MKSIVLGFVALVALISYAESVCAPSIAYVHFSVSAKVTDPNIIAALNTPEGQRSAAQKAALDAFKAEILAKLRKFFPTAVIDNFTFILPSQSGKRQSAQFDLLLAIDLQTDVSAQLDLSDIGAIVLVQITNALDEIPSLNVANIAVKVNDQDVTEQALANVAADAAAVDS